MASMRSQQGGEECHGLPGSVGNLSRQALTARSPPAQRPIFVLSLSKDGPGFIDEDQPPRINAALEGLPPPALAGDAGMVLLARQHGFLKLRPSRRMNVQTVR